MPAGLTPNAPVAFITGGSRGIGRALVESFVGAGYRVAACARSVEGACAGEPDLALACDVTARDDVKRGINRVVERYGRLDVVVNNAGIAGEDPDDDDDAWEHWQRVHQTNVDGVFHVTQAALPFLPDDSGRVINIASVLGLKGVPDQLAYVSAKHAVVGYTRALALKLAPRGITVNAICPGWVDTDMARQRADELSLPPQALGEGVPLGRMARPGEVAALALFVAGEQAAMITGQALTLDGGTSV